MQAPAAPQTSSPGGGRKSKEQSEKQLLHKLRQKNREGEAALHRCTAGSQGIAETWGVVGSNLGRWRLRI